MVRRKNFIGELAQTMLLRMVLAFIVHRGRMTCSQAAGSVASEAIHRGQLTRVLARPRWQRTEFNGPLREALLQREKGTGEFLFIITALLVICGAAWILFPPLVGVGLVFLIAFGFNGAGGLMCNYYPYYVLCLSPNSQMRRKMAFVMLLSAPVGVAPRCSAPSPTHGVWQRAFGWRWP